MKSTFNVYFYIKKDKQKSNGTYPVFARITIDGIANRFNTKVDVLLSTWNPTAQKCVGRSNELLKSNRLLDEIKSSLYTIYHNLLRQDGYVTSEKLKNEFLGHSENYCSLLKLFDKHNDDLKLLIGISKTKATYQKYDVTRRHIANFIYNKYHLTDIAIKDINHLFLTDFELYLRVVVGCGTNTTAKFMQFLKRIVIIARNNGLLFSDPFANYKIRIAPVDRGYLTEEELKIIMSKSLSIERLDHVRDLFVFSCFCGLAYGDMAALKKENIIKRSDDKLWIVTKRMKTNTNVNVPLLEVPLEILNKYKDLLPNQKILPVISNQKLNSYLKELADICGIKKNLTFHLARHTFATTTTLSMGVPIETVSKMLGHTKILTTQIYARITDTKIDNDMTILADKLSKMHYFKNDNEGHEIDHRYECLTIDEKMSLFNLPTTLFSDSEREKRVNSLWYRFSEIEKVTLWKNKFGEC